MGVTDCTPTSHFRIKSLSKCIYGAERKLPPSHAKSASLGHIASLLFFHCLTNHKYCFLSYWRVFHLLHTINTSHSIPFNPLKKKRVIPKGRLSLFKFKMWQPSSALLLVASLLTALPVNADGLYTKRSPVLQVDQKSYDRLIAKSNHASVRRTVTDYQC